MLTVEFWLSMLAMAVTTTMNQHKDKEWQTTKGHREVNREHKKSSSFFVSSCKEG